MPEPVERTCPHCGAAERTIFLQCSSCGGSYFVAPPSRRRRRAQWLGGALAVVAIGVGSGFAYDAKQERDAREARATARAVAIEQARLRRVQAPERGEARALRPADDARPTERLAARAALVHRVEASITDDARARIASGELEGEVVRTDCGPIEKRPDAVPDDRDLSVARGRFDCIAVQDAVINGDDERVADFGFAFVAAVDFDRFTYVWCRNNPPQSERGVSVYVRLERACLGATGKALGTGYVDDR